MLSFSFSQRYTDQSEEDKKRFGKEIKEFFYKRPADQVLEQKLPPLISDQDPLRPPKSPAGSYALFVKELSSQSPDLKFPDLSKTASAKWHAFSEAEKQTWVDKGNLAKDAYRKSVEVYQKKFPSSKTA